jgi:hypothetical protein
MFVAFNLLYNVSCMTLFALGVRRELGLTLLDVVYMGAIALHYLVIRMARRSGQHAQRRNAVVAACRCASKQARPPANSWPRTKHDWCTAHRPPQQAAVHQQAALFLCRVMYAALGTLIVPAWSDWAPGTAVASHGAFAKHLITTSGIFFQNWLAVGPPLLACALLTHCLHPSCLRSAVP